MHNFPDGFPPSLCRIRFQATVIYINNQQLSFLPLPIIPRPVHLPFITLALYPPSTSMTLQAPTPPAGISRGISDSSINKLQNLPGYTTPVFRGKEAQRAKVQAEVLSKVRDLASKPHPILTTTGL